MKTTRILSIFLLILMLAGVFTGCHEENGKNFQCMEDFEQATVGVLTGSSFDLLAKEYFPEAKKLLYMNMTDLILNLKQKKCDGILMDMSFLRPSIGRQRVFPTSKWICRPQNMRSHFPRARNLRR